MTQNTDINPWDTTENLSSFNGSFPKTFKPKKEKKPLKAGKRTTAWKEAIKPLIEVFEEHKITECEIHFEGCLKNNYLGFAHVKRRVNYSEEELVDPHNMVLACQPDHNTVDNEMPKKDSEKLLAEIVAKRGW